MVFLTRNSQNRDSAAVEVTLTNGIELLTEAEIEEPRKKSGMRAKSTASRTERGPWQAEVTNDVGNFVPATGVISRKTSVRDLK
jgi:hypothetical protein